MKILVGILVILTIGFSHPISFVHYKFDPLETEPTIPTELRLEPDALSNYYLIQFTGPVKNVWKNEIIKHGGIIYDYIPHFTFIVSLKNSEVDKLEKLPFVRWIGYYHPAYKISPYIGKMEYKDPARANDPWLNLRVSLFYDADVDKVISQLKDLGAQIEKIACHEEYRIKRIIFDISPEKLNEVAHIKSIKWIEEMPEYTLYNNTTRWVLQTNVSNDTVLWAHGIRGDGQILSVMDTGIDYLSCFFRDPEGDPFGPDHRKIQAHHLYGSAQAYDDHGHGTHVSGTACGNDYTMTYDEYNGMAKNARMVMQDISYGGGNLTPPSPLTTGFQDAMNDGAFAQTNSWGYTSGSQYATESRDIDNFMYNNKYFLVLFAAGNSGPSSSTVHPPATAKDDITVGASCQNPGENNIAGFSSRGPADDGRLEPTVSISGTDANDQCPDQWNPGPNAIYSALNSGTTPTQTCEWVADDWCGTSMATPAACGAAALVRQYYMDGWYPTGSPEPGNAFTPTNDLLKATLINSAVDMGTANIPNNDEGWGRLLLDNALYFAGDQRELRIAEHDGINTNDSVIYTYNVDNNAEPLEIVLVWSDIGGAVNANPAIVNDLDLTVNSPTGETYYGNVFSGGQSTTGGSYDRLNTVECVRRNTPATGNYTITVKGYNVPNGPQHFALCLTGCFSPIGVKENEGNPSPRSWFNVTPVGENARIKFSINKKQSVKVDVYDVSGRNVTTLVNNELSAGEHNISWETNRIPPGIYFIIISSDEINLSRKFILIK